MTTINFEAYCADNRIHELPGIQPCKAQDEDEDDDYQHTIIFKSKEKFIRDFTKWTRKVAQDVWVVGGDDDYYDYYPGNFDLARSIAEEVPEVGEAVRFMEDFAIAVMYGVDGMDDGLGIDGMQDFDLALARYSNIIGQKIFYMAHLTMDEMNRFGGYWMSHWIHGTAKWKKIDHAKSVNQTALRRGLPKDLLPYSPHYLNYFKNLPKEDGG